MLFMPIVRELSAAKEEIFWGFLKRLRLWQI